MSSDKRRAEDHDAADNAAKKRPKTAKQPLLFSKQLRSDTVRLHAEDTSYVVNKDLLCVKCPKFINLLDELLQADKIPPTVELKCTKAILARFVDWLTMDHVRTTNHDKTCFLEFKDGDTQVTWDDVIGLYKFACQHEIKVLKRRLLDPMYEVLVAAPFSLTLKNTRIVFTQVTGSDPLCHLVIYTYAFNFGARWLEVAKMEHPTPVALPADFWMRVALVKDSLAKEGRIPNGILPNGRFHPLKFLLRPFVASGSI